MTTDATAETIEPVEPVEPVDPAQPAAPADPIAAPDLDASTLGALQEQRDFLLRSLDDLEREHDAGDVDDVDYAGLRDGYTARAAAVIRAIEARAVIPAATPGGRRGWTRRIAWVAVVGVFAVLAGVLMARASGSRRNGATSTGDITLDTRQLLADAQTAAAGGDFAKSIDLYGKVLKIQPGNVEALAYRGWSKLRSGDLTGAKPDLDTAVEQDAKYPDVRVFRAVLDVSGQKFDDAANELAVFDSLNPPDLMKQIVTAEHLRARIVAGQVGPKLLVANPPPLVTSGFSADQVRTAAEELAEQARLSDSLKLFDIVLTANPNDVEAHAYKGWAVARAGVQANQSELVTTAMTEFAHALQLNPHYPDALVFRSFTELYGLSQPAQAKADLAAFDALADKPAALTALIDQNGLRGAIDAKLKPGG